MNRNRLAVIAVLAMSGLVARAEQAETVSATQPAAASRDNEAFYRPHTPAEYPGLTPDEMGRRVLKLIDSFKSMDDWTVEHVRRVTGLPVAPVKEREGYIYSFAMFLPDSNWYYGIDYWTNPKNDDRYTSVRLSFGHQVGAHPDDRADMAPVCGMDFQAFDSALQKMGYVPEPQYDQIGRLMGIDYIDSNRMFAWLQMMIRSEGYADDAKRSHTCVRELVIRKP